MTTKAVEEAVHSVVHEAGEVVYPPGYFLFLQAFGEGTYCGWLNITAPDDIVLRPFAEYGLWEHDEQTPIAEKQIGECISIGTSIDGDFLAVHPSCPEGLLWLPRHDERILLIPFQYQEQGGPAALTSMLDELFILQFKAKREGTAYFEPWASGISHLFLRWQPRQELLSLQQLAALCQQYYEPDLVLETEYSGRLFYKKFGGYIRFNYAYEHEVALIFEQKKQDQLEKVKDWLLEQGCVVFGS